VQLDGTSAPASQQALLTRLGVFLGEKVLGQAIMGELSKSRQHRTLLIRIPDSHDDVLAATFARIPWEMALLTGVIKSVGARPFMRHVNYSNNPPIPHSPE
jgi:hypothetical protein